MIGEISALSAAAVWASASIIFARLGRDISPLSLNLLKGAIALVMMLLTAVILSGTAIPDLDPTTLVLLAASGVVGITLGDTSYFNALVRLGPRRALLMTALVPPVTATLGYAFLDEKLSVVMLGGMALTLAGVVWVIRERSDDNIDPTIVRVGIAFALGAVVCQSVGNVLTKAGSAEITALEISIIRVLFGTFGLAIIVASLGRIVETAKVLKDKNVRIAIFAATFLGTYLGIWLLNSGLKYTANTGIAATLSSTSPLFILPLAVVFEQEKLSARAIVGALIAVAGVAILFSA